MHMQKHIFIVAALVVIGFTTYTAVLTSRIEALSADLAALSATSTLQSTALQDHWTVMLRSGVVVQTPDGKLQVNDLPLQAWRQANQ